MNSPPGPLTARPLRRNTRSFARYPLLCPLPATLSATGLSYGSQHPVSYRYCTKTSIFAPRQDSATSLSILSAIDIERKPRFSPLDRTQLLPPASCRGQSRCFITFLRRRPFTDADRSAVWSASATVSGRFPPQNASDADVIDESSASFVERQEKERGLSRSL